ARGTGATRRLGHGARRGRRASLGAGLTSVPTAPALDPADAVMTDPVVPEDRRFCPSCGAPVGRGSGDAPGRTEGYCSQCRNPYSFTPKLSPGDLVGGQYEVVGCLAHGGLGWIYLARDKNVSDRWVVLKGLLNAGDADALAAAVAEQRFLAQVEHPLIVEVYNVVTQEGAAYTVMEYVGGHSLKELLKDRMAANAGRYDPLPVPYALAFVLEILPAFAYLHDLGLLYCDFKPDNLLQVGESVKLIDLGGVRRIDDLDSPIYGTVGYQAPEIAELGPSVASDIFTIGRTLAVLTNEFRGYQSRYATTLPPTSNMPAFARHDAFYRLVAKCCAPDPADRFQTIEELRGQLYGVLRQVVADQRGSGAAGQTIPSTLFEAPVATGDSLGWWELPALRVDEHDPMIGWLQTIQESDPQRRDRELAQAPDQSAEVLLERARTALYAGNHEQVAQHTDAVLAADPWDWRAVWLMGLDALSRDDHTAAAAAFGTVYEQIPGELAPRLALALTRELSGESEAAERDYLVCLRTDGAYASVASFGLARLRSARRDIRGAITALDLVPPASAAFGRARW
ncbi:serine/threonine protein kinase PknG, partial [Kineosphaera limosa NBRC 100340]